MLTVSQLRGGGAYFILDTYHVLVRDLFRNNPPSWNTAVVLITFLGTKHTHLCSYRWVACPHPTFSGSSTGRPSAQTPPTRCWSGRTASTRWWSSLCQAATPASTPASPVTGRDRTPSTWSSLSQVQVLLFIWLFRCYIAGQFHCFIWRVLEHCSLSKCGTFYDAL